MRGAQLEAMRLAQPYMEANATSEDLERWHKLCMTLFGVTAPLRYIGPHENLHTPNATDDARSKTKG